MDTGRYRAFISYSHRDEHWARWLHRALEAYRIPRKLVGAASAVGPVPRRLAPIFRDREDLSSASDLPAKVREALADSGALIVICSPSAAASPWVNEEIRAFRRLGRGERIFALIVDGDPKARGEDGCFPPALLMAEAGERFEPLAADARKWADGRLLAKLKLLAGILGISLDSLRRRDLQKRQRTWALTTIGAVAVALTLALAVTSRIAAEKRRVFAQELVGFKLADLSGQVPVLADAELLQRLEAWSEAEQQGLRGEAGETSAGAILAAKALRKMGLEQLRQGDRTAALHQFERSWGVLAVYYRQQPEDRDILFELGQAEFYIGRVLTEQGRFDAAASAFRLYADITRRLLRAEPENSDWVLEMAFALTNLGQLESEREPPDTEQGLALAQSALQFNQIALVLDPGNAGYEAELEQSHANVADAQLLLCDLGGALHSRMESLRLARRFHEAAPGDVRKQRLLASTLAGIAAVQRSIGLADMALNSLAESERLLSQLIAREPDSALLQRLSLTRRSRTVALLADTGQTERARSLAGATQSAWEGFFSRTSTPDVQARLEYGRFLISRSVLELTAGTRAEAAHWLERAMDELGAVAQSMPDLGRARELLALAVFQHWVLHGTPPEGVMGLLPQANAGPSPSCHDAAIAARLAVMQGDLAAAQGYTGYLLDKGYFEPGFIRFCRAQRLCAEPGTGSDP